MVRWVIGASALCLAVAGGAGADEAKVVWEPIVREDKPKQWVYCQDHGDGAATCHFEFGDEAPETLTPPRVLAVDIGAPDGWRDALAEKDETIAKSFGRTHVFDYGGRKYLKLLVISPMQDVDNAWNLTAMAEACTATLGAPTLLSGAADAPKLASGFEAFDLDADARCAELPQGRLCLPPDLPMKTNYYNDCYMGGRLVVDGTDAETGEAEGEG